MVPERVLFTPVTQEFFGQPPQPVTVPLTRLDGTTAARFQQQWQAQLDSQPRVVGVNLSAVDFIDSQGLGALVSCSKQLQTRGGQVCLVAPQPQVLVLLETVALYRFLPIYLKREDFEQGREPDLF